MSAPKAIGTERSDTNGLPSQALCKAQKTTATETLTKRGAVKRAHDGLVEAHQMPRLIDIHPALAGLLIGRRAEVGEYSPGYTQDLHPAGHARFRGAIKRSRRQENGGTLQGLVVYAKEKSVTERELRRLDRSSRGPWLPTQMPQRTRAHEADIASRINLLQREVHAEIESLLVAALHHARRLEYVRLRSNGVGGTTLHGLCINTVLIPREQAGSRLTVSRA
jgi:hypothetical protein